MKNSMNRRREAVTLALSIALLPPIWAVLSSHLGITTGAVALICAGVYTANGNKREDALKILAGFLLGDVWAVLAVNAMAISPLSGDITLFLTLAVMGGAAVLAGSCLSCFVYLPAWLCGWAIGLTIMGPLAPPRIGTLPFQIAASMAAGVLYVGIGVDMFQKWLKNLLYDGQGDNPK